MSHAWLAVRWVHVIAMAFFVGGQLVLAVAVVPAARHSPDRGAVRAIARRFGYGTVVAIAVLIATGAAMATHLHDWGDARLHAKLGLVALVAVLVLWHVRRPAMPVLDAAIFLASLAIVWLGLAIAGG